MKQALTYSAQGLAMVRIITGGLLVFHGLEIFDGNTMETYLTWDQFSGTLGPFLAYLGKALELVSGLMLVLGFYTRLAGILVAGTFLYITFMVDGGKFWYENQHPFLFSLLGLVFVFTVPGAWSLNKL